MKNINYQNFYEGKFVITKDFRFKGGGIFKQVYSNVAMDYNRRRSMFLNKHLKGKDNLILDIGCGGGTILFTEYGKVIGVDISKTSLSIAGHMYNGTVNANLEKLPFKDNIFDYVVSIDVLGHIPRGQKNNLLKEIKRVLKAGGKSIHSAIETEGLDLTSRLAHKIPTLYENIFIYKHGHFGYEYPSEVISRFERNGFIVLETSKIQGGIFVDPHFYVEWFLGNEYSQTNLLLFFLSQLFRIVYFIDNRILGGKSILMNLTRFILGFISLFSDKCLLPIDYSRGIAVCLLKTST